MSGTNGTATNERHDFVDAPLAPRSEGMMEVASTRAAQEVQAAMVIAKRFPRDEQAAFQRIMQACKRKMLAEVSQYAYPRGGQTVTGPSIRLAEVLAQSWGNMACGTIELEQRDGESVMMSYAWDLETNTRCDKVFSVPHKRDTRNGQKSLTDSRDVYELTANMGARRLRACILAVIPGDIVEAAVAECDKTMKNGNSEPLADRVRKMVGAFADIAVTIDMIEKRLGHRVDVLSESELVQLRKVYQSIKDNMASREQFFDMPKRGVKLDDLGGDDAPGAEQATPAKLVLDRYRKLRPQATPEDFVKWVAAQGGQLITGYEQLTADTIDKLEIVLGEMENAG